MKRTMYALFVLGLSTSMAWADATIPGSMSEATEECLGCHRDDNPGLYQQWGASKHYGANVGCYECHAVWGVCRYWCSPGWVGACFGVIASFYYQSRGGSDG